MNKKWRLLALSFLLAGSFGLPKTHAESPPAKTPSISQTQAFNPIAVKGKVHGTTRIIANVPTSDDHLVIKISNTPLSAKAGDPAPTGGTVTNPYTPNTDLSGVDAKINKYLGVYLTDNQNQIVSFKQIILEDNQVQNDNWSVVWEDNFNGDSIDTSKWNFVQGGGGYGNNELENYTNRSQNARVEDGHLVIQAQKENYQGDQYTSAKLTTEGKGDWTYGKYVIRAKLPQGQGMWPAIWMMPSDYNLYSGWPSCGEIDIMELLGNDPNTVYGTLHYGLPWTHTGTSYSLPNNASFADNYHTFELDWEPGEMRWYIDGVLYQKQNNWFSQDPNGAAPFTYPAPFDRNFYLQLNLAVGGNWPGNPNATTQFPQEMDVDYVKVYKLDGTYREAGPAPTPSSDTGSTLRPPASDGNYIVNGTFDNDTSNWTFQPASTDGVTQFGGNGTMTVDNGALKTTINQPGSANYAVQAVQGNLPIEKGASYKLSFDAWSDSNRTMVTDINGPDKSFARYLQDQTVSLTSSSQHFEYTFKMTNDTDPNGRLEFNMGGGSTSPVWIDNVRLEKLPKDPNAPRDILPDGNYIYNGTFDEGDNRQLFWNFTTVTPAHADATVGSAIPDRELTVTYDNPGKTEDAVRLSQSNLNMEKGKTYLLTFDAKATNARSIALDLTSADRKTIYADPKSFSLDQSMKTYSMAFTMTNESDPHSMLAFLLGKTSKASVTLDNVTLKTIRAPQDLDGFGRIQAKDFQFMSGVQVGDDGNVGWIDPGDWMQYAVNVKKEGDYNVTYYVASGRDGGNVTLQGKMGNVIDGSLGQGEFKDGYVTSSLDVAQTGGWGNWNMVSTTVHLKAGLQTLQVYAPNVNLAWMDFSLKDMADSVGLKNGTFDTDTSGWNSWWGDQWNGVASGSATVKDQALDVHVDSVGNVSFSPQIYQDGLTFVTGKKYTVSFDAKATSGKTINVNIGKALTSDPWFISYAPTQKIQLDDTMKTYTFTFTMSEPTFDGGKLVFEVGNVVSGDSTYKGDITFDNVSITPAN